MLRDLNLGEMKSGVPVLAVSLALEGKASHREMTSKLLSDLCGTVMSTNDVEKSFDKLLKDLPELALDTPRAPQVCKILLCVHSSFCSFSVCFAWIYRTNTCSQEVLLDERGKNWPIIPITQQQCSNILMYFSLALSIPPVQFSSL